MSIRNISSTHTNQRVFITSLLLTQYRVFVTTLLFTQHQRVFVTTRMSICNISSTHTNQQVFVTSLMSIRNTSTTHTTPMSIHNSSTTQTKPKSICNISSTDTNQRVFVTSLTSIRNIPTDNHLTSFTVPTMSLWELRRLSTSWRWIESTPAIYTDTTPSLINLHKNKHFPVINSTIT